MGWKRVAPGDGQHSKGGSGTQTEFWHGREAAVTGTIADPGAAQQRAQQRTGPSRQQRDAERAARQQPGVKLPLAQRPGAGVAGHNGLALPSPAGAVRHVSVLAG